MIFSGSVLQDTYAIYSLILPSGAFNIAVIIGYRYKKVDNYMSLSVADRWCKMKYQLDFQAFKNFK